MPTFEYTAQHDDGRVVRGTAIGESVDRVIQELALKGMLVTKIAPASTINDPIPADFSVGTRTERRVAPAPTVVGPVTPTGNPYDTPRVEVPVETAEEPAEAPTDQRSYFATSVAGPLVGTVPLSDLQMFFRQFASMQGAGVPMSKSLDTLSKQSRAPKLGRIIGEMGAATEQGKPISSAMQRYPEVFSVMMMSLIRAGEEGGFLQSALSQTADYIGQEIEIRNMWRKATIYPKLIVGASIVIILATNAIIASLGKTGGLTSPLTTSSVLVIVIPAVVLVFLYLRVGNANPRLRYNWDAMVLKVPFLGPTLHMFAMAKFGRAFGALHKGGVPVAKALRLGADACGNEYIRSKLHPAGAALERGDGIAGTLAETGAVSQIVLDMLQTGEMSGNVDAMLDRAADHFEADAKMRSDQLAVTTGVVFLLLTGLYVGYIVVTFFMAHFAGLQNAVDQSQGLL